MNRRSQTKAPVACGIRSIKSALELFEGAVLDLAHPLLGDPEASAEEFQGHLLLVEAAGAQDPQFALVQDFQGLLQPLHPPLGVDHVADALIRQGAAIDQEFDPLGGIRRIRVHDGRVEGGIGSRTGGHP